MTPETEHFLASPPQTCDTGTAQVSYRLFGEGRPLMLIHGWPLWGFTYRNVIPLLEKEHLCCAVDLPGAGNSEWSANNDFSFDGHAQNLTKVADQLGWDSFDVMAHNTGATTARFLALALGTRIKKLILIDTEIPHHKPPGVDFAVRMMSLAGASKAFRLAMRSKRLLRSHLGFKTCFANLNLIEGDFHDYVVQPLIDSDRRMKGQIAYAKGINWKRVDDLAEIHPTLPQAVLCIWGEQDPFFPLDKAREMSKQFKDCRGFVTIPNGKLLTHEEFPEQVAAATLPFLKS
jgi:haloalkane dehalogenase